MNVRFKNIIKPVFDKLDFEELEDEKHLTTSLHYYDRGYYVKQDYYNGINTAYLYVTKALLSKKKEEQINIWSNYGQAKKIWKEIISKWESLLTTKTFEKRGDKIWVYLTLVEAYLGISNNKKEHEYLELVSNFPDSGFAINSYQEQKNKLTPMIYELINQKS